MKEFLKNHKWLISAFFSFLLLLGLLIYFDYTNRLDYLCNFKLILFFDKLTKLEKWLVSSSLSSIIILSVFNNWISSFLYGYIFPSTDKSILINTEKIILKVSESNLKIEKLLENTKIDPRDIEQYLKDLLLKNGIEETNVNIEDWYRSRKISLEVKELLLVVVSVFFDQNNILSHEIKNLRLKGETETADFLENIQIYFTAGNADKIKETYFLRKEKIKLDNIIILKQAIKSTETLFAIEETQDLYKELILLEPSPENYFHLAYYCQKLNYFNEALNYYEKALVSYRALANENPKNYLPSLALTLNNLAIVKMDQNEFQQAFENYDEALNIYRKLAKQDPETYLNYLAKTLNDLAVYYAFKKEISEAIKKNKEVLSIYKKLSKQNQTDFLPYIALTFNNLGNLYSDKKEYSLALEMYTGVLQLYRIFAKDYPKRFLIDVAMTLNNLGILYRDKNEFQKSLENYEEALNILKELALENPKTYLPNIALTLNNLSDLYANNNKLLLALKYFEEAIKIYRELIITNPKTYEIDYVRMLIAGVVVFNKNKADLEEAKGILEKYRDVYKAQKLLYRIKELE